VAADLDHRVEAVVHRVAADSDHRVEEVALRAAAASDHLAADPPVAEAFGRPVEVADRRVAEAFARPVEAADPLVAVGSDHQVAAALDHPAEAVVLPAADGGRAAPAVPLAGGVDRAEGARRVVPQDGGRNDSAHGSLPAEARCD